MGVLDLLSSSASCCCPYSVIAALVCVVLAIWAISSLRYYSGTPPGPWGLPLVGYLPFVSKDLHLDYNRLAKKYGDVFSLVLGRRHIIVLNNMDVIKEAFVKDGEVYAGKPREGIESYFGDKKSVFISDGEEWREQRRFIMSMLRDLGFGKSKLEEFVKNEAHSACQEMLKWRDDPHNLRRLMTHIAANTVCSLICDKGFPFGDETLTTLTGFFEFDPELFSPLNLVDLFPIVEYFPSRWTGFHEIDKMKKISYDFVDQMVDEQEKTYDENNQRNLIDAYLKKFKQMEKNPELKAESQNVVYTKEYMRPTLTVLLSAGVDTTSITTSWTILLVAANPEVQARLHAEIDDVIGRERMPTMADRNQMPYTEAVILEGHRYISLVTHTFWHRIRSDTTLRGYKIPKNAVVIANLWNVHHDPNVWEEADKFKPERFLDKDNKIISNLRERVIPFSIGKRNCLGESLARVEVFIYITSFLQKFSFHPPKGKPFRVEPEYHIPLATIKNFDICVKPRN